MGLSECLVSEFVHLTPGVRQRGEVGAVESVCSNGLNITPVSDLVLNTLGVLERSPSDRPDRLERGRKIHLRPVGGCAGESLIANTGDTSPVRDLERVISSEILVPEGAVTNVLDVTPGIRNSLDLVALENILREVGHPNRPLVRNLGKSSTIKSTITKRCHLTPCLRDRCQIAGTLKNAFANTGDVPPGLRKALKSIQFREEALLDAGCATPVLNSSDTIRQVLV